MIEWEEAKNQLIRTSIDKEKAKSFYLMLKERREAVKFLDPIRFTSMVVEQYYEIIKEYLTALMALDGYKSLSHEVLVAFLKKFYKEFSEQEILFIDGMRKLRNRINYDGFKVKPQYWEMNKDAILKIIENLNKILERKLK
jgi:hypothetical protein